MELADNVFEELWFSDNDGRDVNLLASRSLAARLAEVKGLLPFPQVAQKIFNLLGDASSSMDQVAKLIEKDTSLASNVIRVANSALFGVRIPSRTVHQSVFRLGQSTVREIVATAVLAGFFKDVRGLGKVFRDHCAGTAAILRVLGREATADSTEDLYIAGLMHDIGKLLLMQSGEVPYAEALDKDQIWEPDSMHLLERQILAYDHAVLGGHVLKMWKLPEPIPTLVAWHHQPSRAYQNERYAGLVAALRLADAIDPIIARQPDEFEEFVHKLGQKTDCQYCGITTERLLALWPKFFQARVDAISLFGS